MSSLLDTDRSEADGRTSMISALHRSVLTRVISYLPPRSMAAVSMSSTALVSPGFFVRCDIGQEPRAKTPLSIVGFAAHTALRDWLQGAGSRVRMATPALMPNESPVLLYHITLSLEAHYLAGTAAGAGALTEAESNALAEMAARNCVVWLLHESLLWQISEDSNRAARPPPPPLGQMKRVSDLVNRWNDVVSGLTAEQRRTAYHRQSTVAAFLGELGEWEVASGVQGA